LAVDRPCSQSTRTFKTIQIKPKPYEHVLPKILTLLNSIILATDLAGCNCRAKVFAQPNFPHKLLEMATKLTSNELVSYESKEMVLQTT
jgi:hypothetical protein